MHCIVRQHKAIKTSIVCTRLSLILWLPNLMIGTKIIDDSVDKKFRNISQLFKTRTSLNTTGVLFTITYNNNIVALLTVYLKKKWFVPLATRSLIFWTNNSSPGKMSPLAKPSSVGQNRVYQPVITRCYNIVL